MQATLPKLIIINEKQSENLQYVEIWVIPKRSIVKFKLLNLKLTNIYKITNHLVTIAHFVKLYVLFCDSFQSFVSS